MHELFCNVCNKWVAIIELAVENNNPSGDPHLAMRSTFKVSCDHNVKTRSGIGVFPLVFIKENFEESDA